jgi:hypothetical protein
MFDTGPFRESNITICDPSLPYRGAEFLGLVIDKIKPKITISRELKRFCSEANGFCSQPQLRRSLSVLCPRPHRFDLVLALLIAALLYFSIPSTLL